MRLFLTGCWHITDTSAACLSSTSLGRHRQVDYRWAGDANIFLAIELAAGGKATRMVPKVSDLAVR